MKKIILLHLFILLLPVACNSTSDETARMQKNMAIPAATGFPGNVQELSQGLSARESLDVLATVHSPPVDVDRSRAVETLAPSAEAATDRDINPGTSDPSTMVYTYRIVNIYPHDRGSHIQGLVALENDMLLEGSGLLGESSLRRVDTKTGEVTQLLELPDHLFGEGITLLNDRIIQLTWKSGIGFIYDSESFALLDEFSYQHEGWGITHDGQQLIVSDGTSTIHYWDADTLRETRQITVHDELGEVVRINELEFVEGEIFANVWQTDTIIRIDPESGEVMGRIDLSGLLGEEYRDGTEGVLNGIAYDSQSKRLFVTGKRWPKLYEIELLPLDTPY